MVERTLIEEFDPDWLRREPLDVLTDAYYGSIPDPSRRPNDLLYTWLEKKIDERRIQGLIVWRYAWCDNWHAEIQRIKETYGLPTIEIDGAAEFNSNTIPRCATRIQSLLNTLR